MLFVGCLLLRCLCVVASLFTCSCAFVITADILYVMQISCCLLCTVFFSVELAWLVYRITSPARCLSVISVAVSCVLGRLCPKLGCCC